MPVIEMIIISFALAVVIIGIGLGLVVLWNRITDKKTCLGKEQTRE